ncbi:hypothetical protein Acsp01_62780 [Actinoplanes sp. NBRC 101535]|nr:hypothetical protein Acsp01_62780 [Actinoplanes sp. NBRC 101535]
MFNRLSIQLPPFPPAAMQVPSDIDGCGLPGPGDTETPRPRPMADHRAPEQLVRNLQHGILSGGGLRDGVLYYQ